MCMPLFRFSKEVLDMYISSDQPGIHDTNFILFNIIMPVNQIVHAMLSVLKEHKYVKGRSSAGMYKMRVFFRAYFASQYMKTILEFGLTCDIPPLKESDVAAAIMNDPSYSSTRFPTTEFGFPEDYRKRLAFPLQLLLVSYPEYIESRDAKWFQGMKKWFIDGYSGVVDSIHVSRLKQGSRHLFRYSCPAQPLHDWVFSIIQGKEEFDHVKYRETGFSKKKSAKKDDNVEATAVDSHVETELHSDASQGSPRTGKRTSPTSSAPLTRSKKAKLVQEQGDTQSVAGSQPPTDDEDEQNQDTDGGEDAAAAASTAKKDAKKAGKKAAKKKPKKPTPPGVNLAYISNLTSGLLNDTMPQFIELLDDRDISSNDYRGLMNQIVGKLNQIGSESDKDWMYVEPDIPPPPED